MGIDKCDISTTTATSTTFKHSSNKAFSHDDNSHDLLFDDDSDDEEEESLLLVATHASMQRKDTHFCNELVWNNCVAKLNKDGPFGFHNGCRMHHPVLMKLCKPIEPEVIEISKFAPNHDGVTSVELA